MESKNYAFPCNISPELFHLPGCLKLPDRAIEIGSNFFTVPPSDSIFRSYGYKKKNQAKKLEKNLGEPLAFFQFFGRIFCC